MNLETGACFPQREFCSWEIASTVHESVRQGETCEQWQAQLPGFGKDVYVLESSNIGKGRDLIIAGFLPGR